MAITDLPVQSAIGVATAKEGSYMDWPAVFAGAVLASAVSLVLLTFGSAIGLSVTSAHENSGISLAGFSIAAALWLIWVQVSGFMAGGYLTGRMRRRHYDASEHESDIRDGAHGLTVWGLGVLIGAFILLSGASSAVSTATTAATSVAAGVADEAIGGGQLMVDRLLRGTQPAAADANAQRDEISRILVSSVTTGTLEDADRQYMIDTVAARTGVPAEEVQARVDQMWAQAQQVEADARATADKARRLGVLAAFVAAASLLIGAAGAYFGAVIGGNHRDKQTVIEGWVKPWA